uniref:Uncharacterized protein n=1 Tax=Glossina austeni TaxID=7395 RepID=A0A1A9UVR6_GLOAU
MVSFYYTGALVKSNGKTTTTPPPLPSPPQPPSPFAVTDNYFANVVDNLEFMTNACKLAASLQHSLMISPSFAIAAGRIRECFEPKSEHNAQWTMNSSLDTIPLVS